ncbi:hypothetical protein SAMD00019534_041540 [Acytostelium subglobosum LB1]|uniref:hypothetical protein n=1 Tax=Acytostelium subglobosum LB1 TaxID=1410327 RepID=UPI0006448673|nr:hypothetical protein SAMD00019534_041540 [Acytostelium subglobosum LB1]GAM20979.1 hypothetical protein SAMD00019534_041540 [Acytostelium subglobosum LB1]|eukprot:XP_012756113.1 hypothetical protein SAMD00019534_041540 [Acytostelium subglobosum LB1]
MKVILSIILIICLITIYTLPTVSSERCVGPESFRIYDDKLDVYVDDFSWSTTRFFNNSKYAYSGKYSFGYVAKNYDGMYLDLKTGIDPSRDSVIQFMVNGGKTGHQKVYIRLSNANHTYDFYLWGSDSALVTKGDIQPNEWLPVQIDLGLMEPGIYHDLKILVEGPEDHGLVYFDDMTVLTRCPDDKYIKGLEKKVCSQTDCVQVSTKEENMQILVAGTLYRQYSVTFRNVGAKTLFGLQFEPVYFEPRPGKLDIWACVNGDGGRYKPPNGLNAKGLVPEAEFTIGVISKKGPVTFKVVDFAYKPPAVKK